MAAKKRTSGDMNSYYDNFEDLILFQLSIYFCNLHLTLKE